MFLVDMEGHIASSGPRGRALSGAVPCAFAALALAATAPAVAAQSVTGRVVDARSGDAIERAIIELFDIDDEPLGLGFSDGRGRFRIEVGEPGGPYRLTARALSYREGSVDSIQVAPDGADVGDVTLLPAPISLDTLEAEAEHGRPSGRERVRLRQLQGRGTFLAGAIVENDEPESLTHYLAEAAGLMVTYDRRDGWPRLRSPKAPGDCMSITVNHWPLRSSGYRSLDEIRLDWIAAIEIYNTPEDVPDERIIGMSPTFRRCGLVNIWLWNSW